jgi:O-antigen/teichoic acid export membrane protein
MGHLGLGSVMGKLFSLGTTLIMARILSPADYGLMAIAMIIIGFIGFFNEVGIGAAIVQKSALTDQEINGCFVIAVIISFLLFIATVTCSPFIAHFYGNPKLEKIISVLAFAFILGAISTVPMALLRRNMAFKAISSINVLSILIQSITSLTLAHLNHGVWSLVYGFLVGSAVNCIGFFSLSHWRPRRLDGVREASALVIYGLHITSTRIFWYLYTNADKAIVGKLLGSKALGIYDMAFSLATLPSAQVTTLVVNVAAPLFSRVQENVSELTQILLKLTRGLAYVTYPALVGMLVCSRELITVALGPTWSDVLIPFNALCLMGLIKSIDPLLSQVLISTGHAKKLAAYTAMCSVVMLLAVVIGATFDGLRGVSLVWVIVYPLLSVALLRDVSRVTGMPLLGYYRNLWPILKATIFMAIIVLAIRELLLLYTSNFPLILIAEIGSGVIAYALWIIFLDKQGFTEIRQILKDFGIPDSKLQRWPFTRLDHSK